MLASLSGSVVGDEGEDGGSKPGSGCLDGPPPPPARGAFARLGATLEDVPVALAMLVAVPPPRRAAPKLSCGHHIGAEKTDDATDADGAGDWDVDEEALSRVVAIDAADDDGDAEDPVASAAFTDVLAVDVMVPVSKHSCDVPPDQSLG